MASYKRISNKIELITIDNPKKNNGDIAWYNITDAGKKEIQFLKKEFPGFGKKHLQASSCKVVAQRPLIQVNDGYLFLILHFPFQDENKISAGEIEFFVGHGYIITIHNKNVTTLNNFYNSCRKDASYLLSYNLESSAVLLYEILQKLMEDNYILLDRNSVEIDNVDKIIFENETKKLHYEILQLKRNILNLRKIIQNHKNIFKKLVEMESSTISKKQLRLYYNSLVEHSKRVWEITENQKEHVNALYQSSESLMNNKMSNIMKTLTVFSVIVMPLNLLASIFGVNLVKGMPFVDKSMSFWLMIGTMTVCFIITLLVFIRKKWL